jgi:chorismate mutase
MSIFTQVSPYIIAGPCSAEDEPQVLSVAQALKGSSVSMMRAGVWKPRTKPGGFEGRGQAALPWLKLAKDTYGLPITIEVATPHQIELALKYDIDCLWIGARTTVSPFVVQELADVLKGVHKPILIKNPVNPDIDLWQGAIERFMNAGVQDIGAIHRGFSSFNKVSKYRNIPNWSIPIELRRRMPQLPILCDPSHITGRRDLIKHVSQRALDLQFDGLMIETHPKPDAALSDAAQQITPAELLQLLAELSLKEHNITGNPKLHELQQLRQMIDNLDAEVVDIIAKRMNIVEQIALIKQEINMSVYQPDRWRDIVASRSKQGIPINLDENFILKLFEVIHDKSIATQLKIINKK